MQAPEKGTGLRHSTARCSSPGRTDRRTDADNSRQEAEARGKAGTATGRPCSKAAMGNRLASDRLNRRFYV